MRSYVQFTTWSNHWDCLCKKAKSCGVMGPMLKLFPEIQVPYIDSKKVCSSLLILLPWVEGGGGERVRRCRIQSSVANKKFFVEDCGKLRGGS